VGKARVYGGAEESVELTTDAVIKGFVPKVGTDKLTAKVVYQGPAPAPIEVGQSLGEVRIYRNDALMMTAPLKTKTAVAAGGLVHRALDAALQLGEDWLRQAAHRP
jgi:D-alanyl-D-alanine carboxypeptidase (penicillin-binding protein 5/6)